MLAVQKGHPSEANSESAPPCCTVREKLCGTIATPGNNIALPACYRLQYECTAREGLGHYSTTFCSAPPELTRVCNKWLISNFEVGDANVTVQNGSIVAEESVVGGSQGNGHQDTESKTRVTKLFCH